MILFSVISVCSVVKIFLPLFYIRVIRPHLHWRAVPVFVEFVLNT